MGWIFGIARHQNHVAQANPVAIHSKPLFEIQTPKMYLTAGGIENTCLSRAFPPALHIPFHNWLVAGTGIRRHREYCTFLTMNDWEDVLSQPRPNLASLDGHFIALRWNDGDIEVFSDQFGLRTMFFVVLQGCVAFSTRLDWLARFAGGFDPDIAQVGAQWLTYNQMSYQSLVKNVERLGPLGRVAIRDAKLTNEHTMFIPRSTSEGRDDMLGALEPLLHPRLPSGSQLSLGLSGGLDSRVLLALLQSSRKPFQLHLFGEELEPDVKIAKDIAAKEDIKQTFYDEPLPHTDGIMNALKEYAGQMYLASPISSAMKLRHYSAMHSEGKIMIDGGMGEIGRRQFMNRLLKVGTKALTHGDPKMIAPYLTSHRADIFNRETTRSMEQGVAEQLSEAWQHMPSIRDIGPENFVDLLVVRYRFPNYGGPDQSRIDSQILSYMPFAQPSYVQSAFLAPLNLKNCSRFYRSLIRTQRSSLTHFPLVKGTTTYPYGLGPIAAIAYTKGKVWMGLHYKEEMPARMLHLIRDYVRDVVHSRDVRTFILYDYQAIVSLVESFYAGNSQLATEICWWLTFELWRQAMSDRHL